MIISRVPLDGEKFELAKAHLLFNDKNIRITEENFRRVLEDKSLPISFKKRFLDFENPFDAPWQKQALIIKGPFWKWRGYF